MTDMSTSWVALELSSQGERERPETLLEILGKESYGQDHEYFIPAVSFFRQDKAVTICVLEGYMFVRSGQTPRSYFDFERSPYIERVLSHDGPKGRFLQYIPDDKIQELRASLVEQSAHEVQVGDTVVVTEGSYSNLTATVVGLSPDGENAYLSILGLKSLDTYVELPLQFLKP